ncbi:MAG: hypothetical protein ABSG69_10180 [Candidatus Acidiferrum sp.]
MPRRLLDDDAAPQKALISLVRQAVSFILGQHGVQRAFASLGLGA